LHNDDYTAREPPAVFLPIFCCQKIGARRGERQKKKQTQKIDYWMIPWNGYCLGLTTYPVDISGLPDFDCWKDVKKFRER